MSFTFEVGKVYRVKMIDHYVDGNKSLEDIFSDQACYLGITAVYVGRNQHYHVFATCTTYYGKEGEDYDTFNVIPGTIVEAEELGAVKGRIYKKDAEKVNDLQKVKAIS